MSQEVSDFVVHRLHEWGVRTIYGYPGDGINGLMGALRRAEGRVRFIQARHEETAALMACGHAKFSGSPGVCMATSGPGAIHLLNGLYDARLDHQPVVAIVGQQARTALGASYQQEVNLEALFKDVARDYVETCVHPGQARHLIDRAMRIAIAERTVTCVIFPHDIQTQEAVESPERVHGTTFSGVGYQKPRLVPGDEELDRAAEVLNQAEKPAILVGAGALDAGQEVREVAERLGAGIAKALLGKAVMPDDLPYVTGSIGLLGTEPTDWMMSNCDAFLMIGSGFPYSEWLPKEGSARGVQIDVDPGMLSLRYPMEVNLHGDARETLRALLPRLDERGDSHWRHDIEDHVADWWETLENRAMADASPLNPQRVFWELSPRLPDNCILAGDSGSSTNWWARDLKIRPGMAASLSGGLATMGSGMPYAIAAKFVHPDRPVVAAVGDGAMQMNGLNALITVSKYWREWQDPRFVVLVLNNRDLNQVTWEQRVLEGEPKFEASQEIPDVDYAKFAETLGFEAIVMDNPQEVAAGWERAMQARRPVLVEAYVDPEVPPLPPHISFDQATKYLSSMLKGDPERWQVIKQSAKDMWAGIRP